MGIKDLERLAEIFLKNDLMKAETRADQEVLIAGMTLEDIASYAEANAEELKTANTEVDADSEEAQKELEEKKEKPLIETPDSTEDEEIK